jgi:hypothetical protein
VFSNQGDPNYTAMPGDTVTVSQTSANPGLTPATATAVAGPCLAAVNQTTCDGDTPAVLTDAGVAPTAAADHGSVVDGSSVTVSVLGNDTTAGAPAAVTLASRPAHGRALVLASGTTMQIRYTPKLRFSGHDHFSYQLATANGHATAVVTITVRAKAPSARNDHGITAAGSRVTIHVLSNDRSYGVSLRVSAVGRAKHGTVRRHMRSVVYIPKPGFVGHDKFTYRVRSAGGSDTATVRVTVFAPACGPSPRVRQGPRNWSGVLGSSTPRYESRTEC